MKTPKCTWRTLTPALGLASALTLPANIARAGDACAALGLGNTGSIQTALTTALKSAAPNKASNGGLGNQMWATVVDQVWDFDQADNGSPTPTNAHYGQPNAFQRPRTLRIGLRLTF